MPPAADLILAIDQGTTSTRAILFDRDARAVASDQAEIAQHYPQPGWVEHDPEEILQSVLATVRGALEKGGVAASRIAAIGITNQRETTVVWDRASGELVHRAIVWQDRRTADVCERLRGQGAEALVARRTGLLLDPYFSATKIAWILDAVPGARDRAVRGELAFGTIESFLLWRLTGGKVHASDLTNAARTSLCDIASGEWDEELCGLFDVPRAILPEIRGNAQPLGTSDPDLFGAAIPITGMAGDQQAALVGQRCFAPGSIKSTYGTGCFMLMNTGAEPVHSRHRLLTTPAYRIGGETHYALEGAIFVAGSAIQWLRDALGQFGEARETAALAAGVPDDHGVYMVPAFFGLGAPHWNAGARGAIHGLTLDCGKAHLTRAALEAVAYQSLDLIEAMAADSGQPPAAIRVDGGMSANDWLCQFLADILATPVERPASVETTALGAAYLAGIGAGVWSDVEALPASPGATALFTPRMTSERRDARIAGWHEAVRRTL